MLSGENKPVYTVPLKDSKEFTRNQKQNLCSKESCRESQTQPKTNPIFKVESVENSINPPRSHPKSGQIAFYNPDLPPSVVF